MKKRIAISVLLVTTALCITETLIQENSTKGEQTYTTGGTTMSHIQIDQLGYTLGSAKKATLTGDEAPVLVMDVDNQEAVLTVTPGAPVYSTSAGQEVRTVDFSSLTHPGTYLLRGKDGDSFPFVIAERPYAQLRASVLDMLRLQGCGVAVDADVWSHPACHTSEALIYGTDQRKDVSGGWHDAGDYGRYVVPAAKTVADLLWTLDFGWADPADILPLARFELEWLLEMQDQETGGVYHKVTAERFCGFIMPEEETEPLVLCPMSVTATADFAAVMAQASIHYAGDPLGPQMLAAAEHAWAWLEKNKDMGGFTNPPGIVTGEYGDANTQDECYWAACALFRATEEARYHEALKQFPAFSGLGWEDMGDYGNIEYLLVPMEKADATKRQAVLDAFVAQCDSLLAATKAEPYGISLGMNYPWGSNMTVANNAMALLIGHHFVPNPNYEAAALEHIHYLLGRNALDQCFVTGFGSNPPVHPHHRPSEAAGAPMPGMVVGGPDGGLHDMYVAAACKGQPPAKCYIDHLESYASNEITIYWNSPVYFVLSYFDAPTR